MQHPISHHQARASLELKMTPLIDVVFLLLIFFVCTASFQIPEEVLPTPLAPPGAAAVAPPDPELMELEEVVVELGYDGMQPQWTINNRAYRGLPEVETTLADLAEIQNDLPVILDVQSVVPLRHVVNLYDVCRAAGFAKVQFAVSEDA